MKQLLGFLIAIVALANGAQAEARDEAGRILETARVRGGLIVHLGCGDGRLTAALGRGEAFVVHGLDADGAGQVSVERWGDSARLPYAENLVNLLVVDGPTGVPADEILRVLVPGGVACQRKDGGWARTVKPRPAEMDEWGHWLHGPDGNAVSLDRLVGPPGRIQWVDGLPYSKKHWGPRTTAMVTAGGRLFSIEDQTPSTLFNLADHWVLVARDAFNGVVLWRRELPDWSKGLWTATQKKALVEPAPAGVLLGAYGEQTGAGGGRDAQETMVAAEERLFVQLAAAQPLSMLDAATGKVIKTFDQAPPPQQVLLIGGLLLIGSGKQVAALDAQTGKPRWQSAGRPPR